MFLKAADLNASLEDVFPGEGPASLIIFVEPPEGFLSTKIQDAMRAFQKTVEDARRERQTQQRQINELRKEIEYLRQV